MTDGDKGTCVVGGAGLGGVNRLACALAAIAAIAGWGVAAAAGVHVFRPLLGAPRPPVLPGAAAADGEADVVRFAVRLDERRKVFREIAAAEPKNRLNGATAFPNEPWSADDHRAAYERDAVRSVAAVHALNLTQAYLILDEGIREAWPGPDGKPLDATTVPLKPRRAW